MVRRLLVGLVKGALVGAACAALLVRGLGMADWHAWQAYLLSATVGVLVGLVAGKPIWRRGAQIEAGLKAVVGALLGLGGAFALRRWLGAPVDLTWLGAGKGAVGDLPATSLPLLATAIGALYELDNTGGAKSGDAASPAASEETDERTRVATEDAADEEPEAGEGARRRAGR